MSRGRVGRLLRSRQWTAAVLLAAGATNLVLTREHFAPHVLYNNVRSGSLGYGIFFLGASLAEILLAGALLLRPSPRVFRAGAPMAVGLIGGWLIARATAPPLVPEFSSASADVGNGLELAAIVTLLIGLRIGVSAEAKPRFARGWAALAGPTFALLFLLASGSLAHVPFNLAKQGATPWLHVDTSRGFGFASPWLGVAFSKHVILGASWAVLAFVVVAGALFALTAGLTVGLARCPRACRPQAPGIAAVAPAFVAVPTCCGAALPIGATLAGSSVLPWSVLGAWTSATPWVLLGTVLLLSANLVLLARRWRSAVPAMNSAVRERLEPDARDPGSRALAVEQRRRFPHGLLSGRWT